MSLKSISRKLSQSLNVSVISHEKFKMLEEQASDGRLLKLIKSYSPLIGMNILENIDFSKSQIRQDIFALAESGFKKKGFFVDFGATNGIDLSNSNLMEKKFGWSGILAEPGRNWWQQLKKNRTAKIDTRCVWSKTGETLKFLECDNPELSTISMFEKSDLKKVTRRSKETYDVETISLVDLLKAHKAPHVIDYLSIDTEGSEFDILNAFDFDAYDIRCITCEHNRSPNRIKIFDLLSRNGYHRKFEELSMFDDWYVRS
jgi:FkbM family methyltransferase